MPRTFVRSGIRITCPDYITVRMCGDKLNRSNTLALRSTRQQFIRLICSMKDGWQFFFSPFTIGKGEDGEVWFSLEHYLESYHLLDVFTHRSYRSCDIAHIELREVPSDVQEQITLIVPDGITACLEPGKDIAPYPSELRLKAWADRQCLVQVMITLKNGVIMTNTPGLLGKQGSEYCIGTMLAYSQIPADDWWIAGTFDDIKTIELRCISTA